MDLQLAHTIYSTYKNWAKLDPPPCPSIFSKACQLLHSSTMNLSRNQVLQFIWVWNFWHSTHPVVNKWWETFEGMDESNKNLLNVIVYALHIYSVVRMTEKKHVLAHHGGQLKYIVVFCHMFLFIALCCNKCCSSFVTHYTLYDL